jgi:hypothetical protein
MRVNDKRVIAEGVEVYEPRNNRNRLGSTIHGKKSGHPEKVSYLLREVCERAGAWLSPLGNGTRRTGQSFIKATTYAGISKSSNGPLFCLTTLG